MTVREEAVVVFGSVICVKRWMPGRTQEYVGSHRMCQTQDGALVFNTESRAVWKGVQGPSQRLII